MTQKILMIDTETTGSLDKPLNYNVGCAVIDRYGKIYETLSACVKEIFRDRSDLMQSAYYACKIPLYEMQLANGEMVLLTLQELKERIADMCKRWNIKIWCAHNARFDYRAMNNTIRFLTEDVQRYFLPYGLTAWDTMVMAQDVICTMPTYRKFCEKNGYICKNGQLRKTAEILYRFIMKDNDFVEEHRALEDVLIEAEILTYCFRKHKKMRKELWAK